MTDLFPLKYTLEHVVVGWREEAVAFAREHGFHLIVNSDQRPFYYSFGLQDIKTKWYEGIFDLGIRSLLPVPCDVERLDLEEGKLKVVTKGNTKVLFNFEALHLFDLDNWGHIGAEETVEDYLVHDMFDVVSGARLGRDIVLEPTDTFVKLIEFVPSNRIDRNTRGDFKDIITASIITAADIKSFDCSETIVRILLERKLKEHQIKQHDGRSLKIRHSHRHAVKNKFSFNIIDMLDERIVLHG